MAKILLVEDDKSLREIYGVRLLAEGYDIVSAGDGEEALAMAIKERPDLILSDVMMPKISGFDMLDILRSTSETKGIKVIMMTALSSEDQRLRGEQLGADRYLVKSQVGIEDVVRTVHDVLGDMPAPGTPQDPFGSAVPRTSPSAVPQQPQPQPQAQPQQPVAMAQPMPAAPQAAPRPVPEQAPQPTPTPPQPQVAAPQPMPVAQPTQEPSATPQQPQPQPMPQQPVAAPQLVPATPQAAPMPVPEQAPQPQAAAPQTSGLPQPTAPFSTPRPAGLASRIIQPIERPTSLGEPITNLIDRELNEQPEQQASPADNPPVPPAPPLPPMPSATQAPIAPVAPQQEQVPDTHPTSTIPPVGFEETPR